MKKLTMTRVIDDSTVVRYYCEVYNCKECYVCDIRGVLPMFVGKICCDEKECESFYATPEDMDSIRQTYDFVEVIE